jgi:NAD(P)-dependent dehydrogenase (short-subunit alcohol dehydrogenase family)
MFDRIGKEYGFVDVLVNNAGSGESPLPLKDVNLAGFWYNFVSWQSHDWFAY